MENKKEGNENKIILGGINCTMDKIEREIQTSKMSFLLCPVKDHHR